MDNEKQWRNRTHRGSGMRTRALGCAAPRPRPVRHCHSIRSTNPFDLAKFDADPCSLLTKDQVAALVADPIGDVNAMLTFEITGKDLPGNYWAGDRCGGVAKMAKSVVGNLDRN
ncbi:hypothetical protein [Amycolatopsis sp. lyj-23]|uniref:hypothetical protein n=1 Tax=Amycolatopsis sp. lyj-23 TaxID=2789283 RepID=UPI00397A69E9